MSEKFTEETKCKLIDENGKFHRLKKVISCSFRLIYKKLCHINGRLFQEFTQLSHQSCLHFIGSSIHK